MLSGEKEEKAREERERDFSLFCSTAVSDLLRPFAADDRRRHENGWRVIFHCSSTASELLLTGQRPSQMCEYALMKQGEQKYPKLESVEDVGVLSKLIRWVITDNQLLD